MTRDEYLAKQRKAVAVAKKQCEPHMDKIRSIVKTVRATVAKQNAELRKIVRAEVARKNAAAIKGPGKVWQVWKINNHTTEYRDVGSFSVSYLSGCNMYYQWCAHNGKEVKTFWSSQSIEAREYAAQYRKVRVPTEMAQTRKEMAQLRKELAKALAACKRKAKK